MAFKAIETIEVCDSLEKTAIVRGEGVRDCPYGLPVPEACSCAGQSIKRMAPSENEKTKKANRIVYAYHKDCTHCPFADRILEANKKVDCDYGDVGAGEKSMPIPGSPIYPSTTHGTGLEGLYGFPAGYYADNNQSRNLFLGLFSILGSYKKETLTKLAEFENKYSLSDLLKKLQKLQAEYGLYFKHVEKTIKK